MKLLGFHRSEVLVAPSSKVLAVAALFLGVLMPLALLGKIADGVRERETFHFDTPTLWWLHTHSSPLLDRFFVSVTTWGGTTGVVPLTLLICGALWIGGRRGGTWFLGIAVFGAGALDLLAKHLFGRARPTLWLSIAPEYDYGFPSGHAVLSMAFALALLLLAWRTRARWPVLIIGSLSVLLVGLSRLYLGVHYPSDVLAGWLASIVWTSGVWIVGRDLRSSRGF